MDNSIKNIKEMIGSYFDGKGRLLLGKGLERLRVRFTQLWLSETGCFWNDGKDCGYHLGNILKQRSQHRIYNLRKLQNGMLEKWDLSVLISAAKNLNMPDYEFNVALKNLQHLRNCSSHVSSYGLSIDEFFEYKNEIYQILLTFGADDHTIDLEMNEIWDDMFYQFHDQYTRKHSRPRFTFLKKRIYPDVDLLFNQFSVVIFHEASCIIFTETPVSLIDCSPATLFTVTAEMKNEYGLKSYVLIGAAILPYANRSSYFSLFKAIRKELFTPLDFNKEMLFDRPSDASYAAMKVFKTSFPIIKFCYTYYTKRIMDALFSLSIPLDATTDHEFMLLMGSSFLPFSDQEIFIHRFKNYICNKFQQCFPLTCRDIVEFLDCLPFGFNYFEFGGSITTKVCDQIDTEILLVPCYDELREMMLEKIAKGSYNILCGHFGSTNPEYNNADMQIELAKSSLMQTQQSDYCFTQYRNSTPYHFFMCPKLYKLF
uniref:Uncharacterized protein n=1 Tax=Panagrolaimus sp. ES5 TaxID=591445 RepID=A0AC34F4F2_9BILA